MRKSALDKEVESMVVYYTDGKFEEFLGIKGDTFESDNGLIGFETNGGHVYVLVINNIKKIEFKCKED